VSKPRLLKLFPTPVIVCELDDAKALNAELEPAILARQAQDEGVQRSNRGGWQSNRDFPKWAGEAGKRLVQEALGLADAHTARGPSVARVPWSVDVWANINHSGGFNMPHVHGGSFWSCVYFVRAGEGTGGALLLHDPRMPALRMHAPGFSFKDVGSEFIAQLRPSSGLMILFPAWLSHSVEVWHGDGARISVAMNIRAAHIHGR
jgi:uncharacterized protein (TIGR02466 family)